MKSLEGVVMELQDASFPALAGVVWTDNIEEAFTGIDVAFLVGAFPRKDEMDRADLLEKNGGIFTVQGKALSDFAKPTVRVLVVGNPANTNCLIALQSAPKLSSENFSAMTRLDHNRMIGELAAKLKVNPEKIRGCTVWGNHSNTQVPDASHATVFRNGKWVLVRECLPKEYLEGEFVQKISTRGGAVIKARGASSAASAANAALGQMYSWIHDTPEGQHVSMAIPVPASRPYGITEGIIYSFPVITKNGAVTIVEGLECNEFIKNKMKITEEELLSEKKTAWEKLGI